MSISKSIFEEEIIYTSHNWFMRYINCKYTNTSKLDDCYQEIINRYPKHNILILDETIDNNNISWSNSMLIYVENKNIIQIIGPPMIQ